MDPALATSIAAATKASTSGTPDASGPSKIGQVSDEFEAVFLHTMLDEMFKTVEGGGTFGDSNASETWRGMLTNQYASSIVKSGGIGIADAVRRELISIQEGNGT